MKEEFTLTHLLIIVSILFVIIAITIPIFTAKFDEARETSASSDTRAMYTQSLTSTSQTCGGTIDY